MSRTASAADVAVPFIDELETGQPLEPLHYEITQDLIDAYGVASLDLNPVHMDPDWCERARVFGTPKPVQHGMMSMTYMTSVVIRNFGPHAEITSIDSKFTKPGPVGTQVTCSGKIQDIHLLGDGNDFIVIRLQATDQDGDLVGLTELRVRLPRRPDRQA